MCGHCSELRPRPESAGREFSWEKEARGGGRGWPASFDYLWAWSAVSLWYYRTLVVAWCRGGGYPEDTGGHQRKKNDGLSSTLCHTAGLASI